MKQFDRRIGVVRLREFANGNPLREGVKALDGMRFEFEASWLIENDARYADGEWAMCAANIPDARKMMNAGRVAWIASGDIQFEDAA